MKGADFLLLGFLLLLLGVAVYALYLNLPGEEVEFIKINGNNNQIKQNQTFEDNTNYDESKQFYENMRFRDKHITYFLEEDCDEERRLRVEEAFDTLESETILSFSESSTDAEIIITCSEIAPDPEQKGHFIAGEGGPAHIINTSLYAVIFDGKISFFRPEKCDKPNIAIHELLHVLGFDHNNNPNSILYPTLDCNQVIDEYLIEQINWLYSADSLPDLYISEVEAKKSGRYVNFDIKIVNQGLSNAEGVTLEIYAGDRFIKEFELQTIEIGTTKILNVENLAVPRTTKEITFSVDDENDIKELFDNNNQVKLVVAEN